jgi:hypothetical protein
VRSNILKIKKHSIRLVDSFRHFVYLSLWLTLPSLLLGTTISVNSASAADDMVAANLNNELITDQTTTTTSLADTKQVFTAADLKPKVESTPGQKQLIAQNADSDTNDLNKIRQELLVEPLIKLKIPESKPTYPPGLSFAAPSAFGANMGDVFVGLSGATAGKTRDVIDGSTSLGFGLGDSRKLVGLELAYSNNSIRKFGANGSFDLKAHRIVYAKGTNQVGVAAGWNTFANYGTDTTGPSSAYGVVTTYSLLKPNDPVNKMPISLSLGAGGGSFRQGNASTGVFAGAGVQVHPQVGVGLGWSGVGLNLGASFVPMPTIPLTITVQGVDITDNTPGGTIFAFSVGYGFNFLPK